LRLLTTTLQGFKDNMPHIIKRITLFYNLRIILAAVQGDIDIRPKIGVYDNQ
jgi:hypothetical protein